MSTGKSVNLCLLALRVRPLVVAARRALVAAVKHRFAQLFALFREDDPPLSLTEVTDPLMTRSGDCVVAAVDIDFGDGCGTAWKVFRGCAHPPTLGFDLTFAESALDSYRLLTATTNLSALLLTRMRTAAGPFVISNSARCTNFGAR